MTATKTKLLATAAILGSLALLGSQAFAQPDGAPAANTPAAGWGGPMMGGYQGGMMGFGNGGYAMGPGMMFGGGLVPDAKTLEKAKAEIGIKPDQEGAWKAYADAVQGAVDTATGIYQSMNPQTMHQLSPQDRYSFMQSVWQTRNDSLEAVSKARQDLFAALAEPQKASAEKALGGTAQGYGGNGYGPAGYGMMGMMGGGYGMMGHPPSGAPAK